VSLRKAETDAVDELLMVKLLFLLTGGRIL
jgi:hypothetical protein